MPNRQALGPGISSNAKACKVAVYQSVDRHVSFWASDCPSMHGALACVLLDCCAVSGRCPSPCLHQCHQWQGTVEEQAAAEDTGLLGRFIGGAGVTMLPECFGQQAALACPPSPSSCHCLCVVAPHNAPQQQAFRHEQQHACPCQSSQSCVWASAPTCMYVAGPRLNVGCCPCLPLAHLLPRSSSHSHSRSHTPVTCLSHIIRIHHQAQDGAYRGGCH